MKREAEVKAFAILLNSLDPNSREEMLNRLKIHTTFCWNCGFDENEPYSCQCTNDE